MKTNINDWRIQVDERGSYYIERKSLFIFWDKYSDFDFPKYLNDYKTIWGMTPSVFNTFKKAEIAMLYNIRYINNGHDHNAIEDVFKEDFIEAGFPVQE